MPLPDRPTDGSKTEHCGWRNLTPHPLRICGSWAPSDGADIELLPWPGLPPLRLEEEGETVNAEVLHTENPRRHGMNGWTLRTVTYKAPATMPPMIDGVRWIVSLPCLLGLAAAGLLRDRPDLFAPDTGAGAIRDENGQVVGTQGFVRLALAEPLRPFGDASLMEALGGIFPQLSNVVAGDALGRFGDALLALEARVGAIENSPKVAGGLP